MIISKKEAFQLLSKWKEESALLAIVGERPLRDMLHPIENRGVRWSLSQSVRVSTIDTERRFVEFVGPAGNLSLSLKLCRRFFYEDYRNAPRDQREAAEALTLSALSIFFPSGDAFLLYEMREPVPFN